MLHHLAFDDGFHHVLHAGPFGEEILAGLEFGARLQREYAADEDETVRVHHPFVLEEICNLQHAQARRDSDDLVLLQRPRRFELALAEDDGCAGDDQDEHQCREHSVADDHQRIARAP
jgi:hypothetical protein